MRCERSSSLPFNAFVAAEAAPAAAPAALPAASVTLVCVVS